MIDDIREGDDLPDLIASHLLMSPLAPAQQEFIDVLFRQATASGSWPIFDWTRRVLRNRRIDAAKELPRFPHAVNRTSGGRQYRHVWTDGGGAALNENSRVQLAYPPSDYGATWDAVRVRCAGAVRSIRQTLETLP